MVYKINCLISYIDFIKSLFNLLKSFKFCLGNFIKVLTIDGIVQKLKYYLGKHILKHKRSFR